MSRSWTSDITSSAVSGAELLVIGANTLLARGGGGTYAQVVRSRSGFVALALAIAGCGSSQATSQARTAPRTEPQPQASRDCGPASAKTLAASPLARVYELGKGVYGCTNRAGKSYRIGTSGFCTRADHVGPIAVSGQVAAYGVQRCGVDTGTGQVVVRNLAGGTIVRAAPATSRVPGPEAYQSVGAVVVKADGAVGWIGEARSIIGRGAVIEVHRYEARGQAKLDQGAGIALASLRLQGSQLSWTHAGHTRTATLS
jgi:hypothetical protein